MARSASEAVRAAAIELAEISDTPRLDAELLMAHALGVTREALLLGDHAEPAGFATLLARRRAQEPVAYLTGVRDFWTVTLEVGPGVLIPRPDSETLIEAALAHFSGGAGPSRVLDLGTGSGALLLAALAEWPDATGLGIERSAAARAYALRNAARIAPGRADISEGDWTAGLSGRFDLILCNPPYVEAGATLSRDVASYEPAEALFAGADGMDDYRRLAPVLSEHLAAGGAACVEIGADQRARAGALFAEAGFDVAVRQDLGGRDRCLVLTTT